MQASEAKPRKIKKKEKPHFAVPNFGAKNRKRVLDRWRRQRGIDNKLRISKKFHGNKPSIGYKNSAEARFRNRRGMLEFLVHNEKEMLALEHRNDAEAKLFHALSRRKKLALAKLASEHGIRLVRVPE
ncbi:MAG: eL32 family ribosomal protein [Candidatus Micrarchaeaceae archaeon]